MSSEETFTKSPEDKPPSTNPPAPAPVSIRSEEQRLLDEAKLLRDTLELLWDRTLEQRKMCEELQQENEYLQGYIDSLMSSSNILDK